MLVSEEISLEYSFFAMPIDNGENVQSISVFNNDFGTRISVVDFVLHRSKKTHFTNFERSSHIFHEIVFCWLDHQSKFVYEL